ncbi:hypothetical protein ACPA9J_27500 [Pseudomonas aeruginosa]
MRHHQRQQRRRPAQDGDYLDHDQRYARSDEFIELLKRTWTSTEPFDFRRALPRGARLLGHPSAAETAHSGVFRRLLGKPR